MRSRLIPKVIRAEQSMLVVVCLLLHAALLLCGHSLTLMLLFVIRFDYGGH